MRAVSTTVRRTRADRLTDRRRKLPEIFCCTLTGRTSLSAFCDAPIPG